MELKELIFLAYVLYSIAMFLVTLKNYHDYTFTLKDLQEVNDDLNAIGIGLLYLLGIITNPLFFVVHFIDWLIHVKKED